MVPVLLPIFMSSPSLTMMESLGAMQLMDSALLVTVPKDGMQLATFDCFWSLGWWLMLVIGVFVAPGLTMLVKSSFDANLPSNGGDAC
tara:strand:+ start:2481 stop:2744 length:264 start_codon:yes stop_codon:yes gene_type:complete